jgi:hypothetical protein
LVVDDSKKQNKKEILDDIEVIGNRTEKHRCGRVFWGSEPVEVTVHSRVTWLCAMEVRVLPILWLTFPSLLNLVRQLNDALPLDRPEMPPDHVPLVEPTTFFNFTRMTVPVFKLDRLPFW